MAELTLDFHIVSKGFMATTSHTEDFVGLLKEEYKPRLDHIPNGTINHTELTSLYESFLSSYIFWDVAAYTDRHMAEDCQSIGANFSLTGISVSPTDRPNELQRVLGFNSSHVKMPPMQQEEVEVIKIVHGLHYASITILSVLVVETVVKIVCVGKRFLKKKFEMFDAAVVFISFILDIVFVEGLENMHLDAFIVVVSFLLPWRVIRVTNSLVVAVIDQHRFHMKMLFKQKKKVQKQLAECQDNGSMLQKQVDSLRNLCASRGVPDWEVNKTIGQTLSPNGHQGGLKALSKLVFQAAESFAPLTGSQRSTTTSCNNTPETTIDISPSPSPTPYGSRQSPAPNGHIPQEYLTQPSDHRIIISDSADEEVLQSGGSDSEDDRSSGDTPPGLKFFLRDSVELADEEGATLYENNEDDGEKKDEDDEEVEAITNQETMVTKM